MEALHHRMHRGFVVPTGTWISLLLPLRCLSFQVGCFSHAVDGESRSSCTPKLCERLFFPLFKFSRFPVSPFPFNLVSVSTSLVSLFTSLFLRLSTFLTLSCKIFFLWTFFSLVVHFHDCKSESLNKGSRTGRCKRDRVTINEELKWSQRIYSCRLSRWVCNRNPATNMERISISAFLESLTPRIKTLGSVYCQTGHRVIHFLSHQHVTPLHHPLLVVLLLLLVLWKWLWILVPYLGKGLQGKKIHKRTAMSPGRFLSPRPLFPFCCRRLFLMYPLLSQQDRDDESERWRSSTVHLAFDSFSEKVLRLLIFPTGKRSYEVCEWSQIVIFPQLKVKCIKLRDSELLSISKTKGKSFVFILVNWLLVGAFHALVASHPAFVFSFWPLCDDFFVRKSSAKTTHCRCVAIELASCQKDFDDWKLEYDLEQEEKREVQHDGLRRGPTLVRNVKRPRNIYFIKRLKDIKLKNSEDKQAREWLK